MPEDIVIEMGDGPLHLTELNELAANLAPDDLPKEIQNRNTENEDFKMDSCSFSKSLLDDCCEMCENKPASELGGRCCTKCSSCGHGCCGICPRVPCCPLPDRCNWPVVTLIPPMYPACCTGVCQTCSWKSC